MMRRLASPRFVVRLICIVIVTKLFVIVYEWLIDVESGMLICIFRFLIMLLGMSSSLFYPVLLACSFYRAMLCIRGTSHLSVCLCPSVRSWSSTKTAKRRITQTTPHDSPGTLVFCCQRSPRNSNRVTPYGGTKCRWGGSKSATFDK